MGEDQSKIQSEKIREIRKTSLSAKEKMEHPEKLEVETETAAVLEGMGEAEETEAGAEVAEVREKTGEEKPVSKTKAQVKKAVHKEIEESAKEIKARLLKETPSERVMRHEIKLHLKKQERELKRKCFALQRRGAFYELTKMVAKLREIKETLTQLAYATYEMIKNLWLKVVHGIV